MILYVLPILMHSINLWTVNILEAFFFFCENMMKNHYDDELMRYPRNLSVYSTIHSKNILLNYSKILAAGLSSIKPLLYSVVKLSFTV